jgi:hypothetical protein
LPESYEAALDEKTAAAAANKRPLTSSSKKTKKKSAAPVASVPLIQRMIGADNGNANTTVSPKSPKQVPFFFSSRTSPTANQVVQALRSEVIYLSFCLDPSIPKISFKKIFIVIYHLSL